MSNTPQAGEKAAVTKVDRVIEPETVPTYIVNRMLGGGYFGSLFDVVLAENRIGYDTKGEAEGQALIVARIRFDRDFAKMLHTQLGNMLAVTEPASKDQMN
ncbi:hypothetical protein ACLBXJ_26730 [Methylobacterium mesophilicum]